MTVYSKKLCLCSFLLLWVACSKSPSPTQAQQPRLETVLRIQWCGTDRLVADPEAVSVRAVAELPETQKVLERAIQKLSIAPWTMAGLPIDIEASSNVRSLIQEVMHRESAFELVTAGKDSLAAALAVHARKSELARWTTNLAASAASLLGSTVLTNRELSGWMLYRKPAGDLSGEPTPPTLNAIYLTSHEEWLIVGLAPSTNLAAQVARHVIENHTISAPSNAWLKSSIRTGRLAELLAMPTNILNDHPSVEFTAKGRGGAVYSEATFHFSQPVFANPEPWQVPTNLIEKPGVSFSAVRGLDQLLGRSHLWTKLSLQQTPNQFFVWALDGQPRLTFFAANVTNAAGFVDEVVHRVLPTGDAWLNEEGIAGFKKSSDGGLEWQGIPYVWPFLRPVVTNDQNNVLGGTFVYVPVLEPLSPAFFESALKPGDLVYYGWERTGPRIEHWLFIGQFIRFVSGKAQMPFEAPSVNWLKALQNQLGESTTRLFLQSPQQLQMNRSSSLGLTAIELHLLADWLESPKFPAGLHTLLATPEPRP